MPTQIEDDASGARRRDLRRHALAWIASLAAHAAVVAAIVLVVPAAQHPHAQWILAYLVEFDSAGAASRGEAKGSIHPDADASSHVTPARLFPATTEPTRNRPGHRKVKPNHDAAENSGSLIAVAPKPPGPGGDASGCANRTTPNADSKQIDQTEMSSLSAGIASGHRDGAGNGLGGDGEGNAGASARVAYGRNPTPAYPSDARRHQEQGTVLLRVLVGADGAVARVEVIQSSGFDSLDESALETVRMRWRFIPARRDGIAVESWVEVPIRFTLTEAATK